MAWAANLAALEIHAPMARSVDIETPTMLVYDLDPGMAVAYPKGALHSPKREGDTRLIRIEGADVTKMKRDKYTIA